MIRFKPIFFLALFCSGCTALDPNRHVSGMLQPLPSLREGATALEVSGASDLRFVLNLIDRQQAEYMRSGAEIDIIRSAPPLLAAALGVAAVATGGVGSGDLQRGLVGGALGLLGGSAFLADRNRQEVYRNGADAVSCLKDVYAPLQSLRPGVTADLLARLQNDRARLASARAILVGPFGPLTTPPWSEQTLNSLDQTAAMAESAISEIVGFESSVAFRLHGLLRRVVVAVDREISRATPDPAAAFRALTGNFSGMEGLFPAPVGTGPAVVRGATSATSSTAVTLAAEALRATVAEADRLLRQMQPLQEEAWGAECRPATSGSGVELEASIIRLQRVPTEFSFVLRSGGAYLAGETAGFALNATPSPRGMLMTLVASASAAGRRVQLIFTEASNDVRRVLVVAPDATGIRPDTVAGAAVGGVPRSPQRPAAQASPGAAIAPNAHQIRFVLRALGLPIEPGGVPAIALTPEARNQLVALGAGQQELDAGRIDAATWAKLVDRMRSTVQTFVTLDSVETASLAGGQLVRIHCFLTGKIPAAAEATEPQALAAMRVALLDQQLRAAAAENAASRVEVTGRLTGRIIGRLSNLAERSGRCGAPG